MRVHSAGFPDFDERRCVAKRLNHFAVAGLLPCNSLELMVLLSNSAGGNHRVLRRAHTGIGRQAILNKFEKYIAQELVLTVSGQDLTAIRGGQRAILKDAHDNYSLGKYVSGQLPYYYRKVEGIVADFASEHSALESVFALATALPTVKSFQQSHCGEIIAAHFVEQKLKYRRLYSKLTLLSSQNTNAHKMDGLFVDCSHQPYNYLFVEAKASVLPTESTPTKTHRSGLLKEMVESLEKYHSEDVRFEFSRIRDNLSGSFTDEEAEVIRADLLPPGPSVLKFMGMSVTNGSTVNAKDDDFILCQTCSLPFDYYALVVTDLGSVAGEAYGHWEKMKGNS